jgi:hypothetical protein
MSASWTPQLQGAHDISIMEYAIGKYNPNELFLINHFHIYLQVTSLYDILIYNTTAINLEIIQGSRISSHTTTIQCIDAPKPPSKAKQIWRSYVNDHLIPYANSHSLKWDIATTPTYKPLSFISNDNKTLYNITESGITNNILGTNTARSISFYTHSIPCELPREVVETFTAVDIAILPTHIQILCQNNISMHGSTNDSPTYHNLCDGFKNICGYIHFPPTMGSSCYHI